MFTYLFKDTWIVFMFQGEGQRCLGQKLLSSDIYE